jgi:hypothetical protein
MDVLCRPVKGVAVLLKGAWVKRTAKDPRFSEGRLRVRPLVDGTCRLIQTSETSPQL